MYTLAMVVLESSKVEPAELSVIVRFEGLRSSVYSSLARFVELCTGDEPGISDNIL